MTADFNGGGPDISGDGMTFGLGAETMITDRVSARIEFTRSDMDLDGSPVSIQGNTLSLGLAMHF